LTTNDSNRNVRPGRHSDILEKSNERDKNNAIKVYNEAKRTYKNLLKAKKH